MTRFLVLITAVSGATFWIACGGSQSTLKPTPRVQDQQAADAGREAEERAEAERKAREEAERAAREAEERARAEAEARAARTFSNVYFDYDRFNIRDDQKPALASHAEKLKANSDFKVTVEGHCDERGTIEYNLALGQKRADSTRSFLVRAGVEAGRLTTVSYGKERPADPGHDESAWGKNRRAEFKVTEPALP
ncbi:MAG: peptidoglycan-associated lipoprotein [Candidatus Handelsmanbacteria bacterium RIFCSPLOWO2_12_FULL_64_10]|uniref:Peptidoglycan-associated lipoprotein n=1 Tax=Handelsmanbacteria sp. (strain RIFCSPLOWO2_12_FULL_64_10) TaxID=1817868 RepID=A0A1F6D4U2_HANXR|nr:MAG: peptidoglycan-associated lipoprotein [Candidatus Handelsmanbacteria bacterium RIFCSPLOWO2_12_FULL_64_10]